MGVGFLYPGSLKSIFQLGMPDERRLQNIGLNNRRDVSTILDRGRDLCTKMGEHLDQMAERWRYELNVACDHEARFIVCIEGRKVK